MGSDRNPVIMYEVESYLQRILAFNFLVPYVYGYTTHTLIYPYKHAKHKFAHHIYVYGKEKERLKKERKY